MHIVYSYAILNIIYSLCIILLECIFSRLTDFTEIVNGSIGERFCIRLLKSRCIVNMIISMRQVGHEKCNSSTSCKTFDGNRTYLRNFLSIAWLTRSFSPSIMLMFLWSLEETILTPGIIHIPQNVSVFALLLNLRSFLLCLRRNS